MTATPQWTGRESSALEYLRLRREPDWDALHEKADRETLRDNDLAQRAQALIADNARLLTDLRDWEALGAGKAWVCCDCGHYPMVHHAKGCNECACDSRWPLSMRFPYRDSPARYLPEPDRNPTGDGHRYGHASEDEITANQNPLLW